MRFLRILTSSLLVLAAVPPAAGPAPLGPAYQVADIDAGSVPHYANPIALGVYDSRLYFSAHTPLTGRELWRTDGTLAGTGPVDDLCAGACGAFDIYSSAAALFEDALFFPACAGVDCRLWQARGDSIVPVAEAIVFDVFEWNGALCYTTLDGEIWKSDGTSAGSRIFQLDGLTPVRVVATDDSLFVEGVDTTYTLQPDPSQLWRTDGTDEGTLLLRESPEVRLFPDRVGGKTLFSDAGRLWWSDGTGVERWLENPPYTRPVVVQVIGGVVFLLADGRELWRSDGTSEGTFRIAEADESDPHVELFSATYDEELYFALGAESRTLYKTTDLSAAAAVADFPDGISRLEVFGEELFVGIGFPTWALWTTEGTPETTSQLFSLTDSSFTELAYFDGSLYFSRATAFSSTLVRFDPQSRAIDTLTGESAASSSDPRRLTRDSERVLFEIAFGAKWISAGTPESTFPLPGGFRDHEIVSVGERAFLQDSRELWSITDGGAAARVFELPPGESFVTGAMAAIGSDVLFLSIDLVSQADLWRGDPESGEIVRIAEEVERLRRTLPMPPEFVELGDVAVLVADGALVRSDGTAEGTRKIFDVSQTCNCFFVEAVRAGDHVYFSSREASSGAPTAHHLWRTDATPEGTALVRRFAAADHGSSVFVHDLVAVGDRIFFAATDGEHGNELWTSDGTEAGTVLVRDLREGPGSSHPEELISFAGRLFFTADNGVHGRELWTSDGTPGSTRLFLDLRAGRRTSSVRGLTVVDDRMVFAADGGLFGLELWTSDGTRQRTRRFQDLEPGPRPSDPKFFTEAGGLVFFNAGRAESGFELWAVPRSALAPLEASFHVTAMALEKKPVTLTDTSLGRPDAWCWRFGDEVEPAPECSATTPSPRHAYARPGSYTVELRVERRLTSGFIETSSSLDEIEVVELTPRRP